MVTIKAKIKDKNSSWEEDFKVISYRTAERDILTHVEDFNSRLREDQFPREFIKITTRREDWKIISISHTSPEKREIIVDSNLSPIKTLKHDTVRSFNFLELGIENLKTEISEEKKKDILNLISNEIKKVKQTLSNYYNTISS